MQIRKSPLAYATHALAVTLTLFACLLPGRTALAQDAFTFVQLCDPQLGITDYKEDICAFEQAVKQINLLTPDFILICGDMVHKPNGTSLSDFRKIAAALQAPCRYVAGNHDQTRTTPGDLLETYRKMFGKDCYTFTCGRTLFVVINTDLMRQRTDDDAQYQIKWIAKQLAAARAAGQASVLVGHHPPFVERPDEADLYANIPLTYRQPLLRLCEQYGVRFYLSGHTHRLIQNRYGAMELLSGESTSKNVDGRPRGFRLWHSENGVPAGPAYIPLYLRKQVVPKPPYDRATAKANEGPCRANLRLLDAAKELAAMRIGLANEAAIDPQRVWQLVPGGMPSLQCPAGGRYELGPMGRDPACTHPDHALPYFYQFEEFRTRAAYTPRF